MADVGEFDWESLLTDDVIQDLLYSDMEDGGGNEAPASKIGKRTRAILSDSSLPADFIQQVSSALTLSEFGKQKIDGFWREFVSKPESATVIRHYPTEAVHAQDYFNENTSRIEASKFLLDAMKLMIMKGSVKEDETKGGSIQQFESETLEYIAGYTLNKARGPPGRERFRFDIVKLLCNDQPRGSFISFMERKAGCLMYPTEEYMFYVEHVYLTFCKEANRHPSFINFENAKIAIFSGQYYESFIHRVYDLCVEDASELDIRQLVTYVTSLMIRVFSHSFAKRLFERLHDKVTTGAVSLRSQLSQ